MNFQDEKHLMPDDNIGEEGPQPSPPFEKPEPAPPLRFEKPEPEIKPAPKKEIKKQEIEEPAKKKRDWTMIDLSKGKVRESDFGGSRGFYSSLKRGVRDVGTVLNASQREEVMTGLKELAKGGLTRQEFNKFLDEQMREGKLNRIEAKKLRSQFKARRGSSGFF